ncbi:metal-dependent hydrolase [Aestuariibacter sp. AA17]|uniref:Metal-dependent hydrolase n=1 Tax=Fluctibacter corallii TaxID=2984329 RepID=A0ABT3A446_9ALTE|nr:metal-dependent hydrolase [Aestuariibacter sp. AA17]MCV2883436.1 metal-dependent hydrolase [Aestuariibacter sp. AA17]
MANGYAHSFAGTAVGLAVPLMDKDTIKETPELLVAGPLVGNFFGKLPDIIEPAFKNPNHRQFFHSIALLAAVGYGVKKAYDWQPEDRFEKVIRGILLCAGAGYLSHLALDAITPRSHPLVGKL